MQRVIRMSICPLLFRCPKDVSNLRVFSFTLVAIRHRNVVQHVVHQEHITIPCYRQRPASFVLLTLPQAHSTVIKPRWTCCDLNNTKENLILLIPFQKPFSVAVTMRGLLGHGSRFARLSAAGKEWASCFRCAAHFQQSCF